MKLLNEDFLILYGRESLVAPPEDDFIFSHRIKIDVYICAQELFFLLNDIQ